jgi:tRNA splicing endonuclease
MSDQVVNLYRSLEEVGLVGKNAFKFGSPDEIVLVSGGPYSHYANLHYLFSMLMKNIAL